MKIRVEYGDLPGGLFLCARFHFWNNDYRIYRECLTDEILNFDICSAHCVLLGVLQMGQKASLQNTSYQCARRAEINLPRAMLEVRELREQVRLAETAAMAKKIVAHPDQSANFRIN